MTSPSPSPAYKVEKVEVLAQVPDLQARVFTLAPGEEIPWHFHSQVTDWYFCLEGAVRIETRAPRRETVLEPGGTGKVEPKTAHHITNAGATRCRFLLLQGVGLYDYQPVGAAAAKD